MPSTSSDKATDTIAFDVTTNVPLLLLPVRLETRFRNTQLLIRVYPDTVHVDSFEPRLTKGEVQWGKHFWQQTWVAMHMGLEKREPPMRNAWAQLAQVFGPRRAAWIATELTPRNLGEHASSKDPDFPKLPDFDPQTTHTPCTDLLPDYWVASGRVSKKVNGEWSFSSTFFVKGRAIQNSDGSDRIIVMPPLNKPVTADTLKNDPDAGWLVDFDKAVEKGMGLRVKLDLPPMEFQIDQLLVFGVKASLAPQKGMDRLNGLFQAHHHTDGLSFIRQGTPTNNTSTASSGYNTGDAGSVESFQVERVQQVLTEDLSNSNVLARALGISPAVFANIQDANAIEQHGARAMNDAIWPATWGYFLEEMLALKGTHRDEIEQMRDHFVNYVRARGPLPTLRVGRQPYGVLPVLPLGESGSDSVKEGPVACLRALRAIWREMLRKQDERGDDLVPRLKRLREQNNDREEFALTLQRILAMAPTAVSYVGRPCMRIMPSSDPTSPEGAAKTGNTPLPPNLQVALDAVLGSHRATPHQRTVFATQANLWTITKPLTHEDDFKPNGASSLFNLLRDKTRNAQTLEALPAPDRQLLLKETLDLCSHRLDAWITSVATKRLEDLRQKQREGICIGGYGWVEHLQPDLPGKDNHGFIHAPSLAHATTAAVLRSGYQSRRMSHTPSDSNALAINLSSERVRLALHLIDGVRGGQSLGVLLGYRFERRLHEKGLGGSIPNFRKIAPGSTHLLSREAPTEENKDKLQHAVLDGLELLQAYKHDLDEDDPHKKKIPPDLFTQCQSELKHLDEAVDAVADLVLAESVHHVAQGNHVRAGATLEAIARGEAPPPELDFIRTPRTGINHTHRIGLVFGAQSTQFPWGMETARAQAEPILNAWVAQLLGPQAAEAFCYVTYDPPVKTETLPLEVTIKDLGLAPLDLVYLIDGDLGGQQSEIEQRILYHVLKDRPSITNISLTFDNPARELDSSADAIPPSLAEILEVARTIRRFITGARILEPRDLDLPENVAVDTSSSTDSSLVARASAARKSFVTNTEALRTALPGKPEDAITNPTAVPDALKTLAAYGLMGAIPVVPLAPNKSAERALKNLHAQATSVLDEAHLRQKRAQSFPDQIQNNAQAVAVLHELFGKDFCALPAFTPLNGKDLNQTFAKSMVLQGGDPQESLTWFQRMARVRDGVARLDATMLYAEALNGPLLNFQVGQLPIRDGERWLALENPPQGNRLSLVCLTTVTDFMKPLTGLLIDEWVEMVPNKEEVTGLTFHYDAPQPRAPQALLLAMAPEGVDRWDSATLENTLRETLELAKLRAVDLTALGELGQYLPAMYVQHDPNTGHSPLA